MPPKKELKLDQDGLQQHLGAKVTPTSLKQHIEASVHAQRRMFWLRKGFSTVPLTATAAAKLLSMHATTAAAERNWSAWGRNYTSLRSNLSMERAEQLIYVKANMAARSDNVDC